MLRKFPSSGLPALVAAASIAAAAGAADLQALGPGGELFTLRSGFYGELFPDGTEASADVLAMALESRRGDEPGRKVLVPGTGGSEVEANPAVVYEDTADILYLLWESRDRERSRLLLVAHSGGAFSEVIEVSDSQLALASSPQLAVTRSTFRLGGEESEGVDHQRTVLHLVWTEDSDFGQRVRYSPIALLDGSYIGQQPTVALDDLLGSEAPGVPETRARCDAAAVSPGFYRTVRIRDGADTDTVVVAFVDVETATLVTVRVRTLPGELGFLADKARSVIIGTGLKSSPVSGVPPSDAVHSAIMALGDRLHPGIVGYMADEARERVLELEDARGGDLELLAEEARSLVIGTGARASSGGVLDVTDPERRALVEIGNRLSGEVGTQLIELAVISARPVPEEVGEEAEILASPSGHDVVMWWKAGQEVRFVVSAGAGWSEASFLRLGEELSLDTVPAILGELIRRR